jgi:ArsR family transcriptional regulator, lead/cadmium/zinc/bismuth-responsive transcriptional repressor
MYACSYIHVSRDRCVPPENMNAVRRNAMALKNIYACKVPVVHEDLVLQAKKKMPDDGLIRKTGDFFKILGDPSRIKIINALFYSALCVGDLAAVLDMSQSAVSHQLKLLKSANLVRYRKDGKVVTYSLPDDHVRRIYEQGLLHVKEA